MNIVIKRSRELYNEKEIAILLGNFNVLVNICFYLKKKSSFCVSIFAKTINLRIQKFNFTNILFCLVLNSI